MGKNIVICCDGTGNEVEGNLSNVLKLFRIAEKSPAQRVYYHPGIGTIGSRDNWTRLKQDTWSVFGLVTGYGLDADTLAAYQFICDRYEDGDSIFLFGFSRGAYTMRVLAAFIHMVGLLPPDQSDVASYALTAYKRSGEVGEFKIAWDFSRVMGGRRVPIKFVGCWDTVASVIVPRPDRLYVPTLQMLPYTRTNPSVMAFRHAMAIDEKRRMFRLNRWIPGQNFVADPFGPDWQGVPQDIKQVWFAGVHSDVGGGYPEDQSAASKFPLQWMIDEAVAHGLKINEAIRTHLVDGAPLPDGRSMYVAPSATAKLHDSMTAAWRIFEYIPKSVKWNEWPRKKFLGLYIPDCEPRSLVRDDPRPLLHQSVIDRKNQVADYQPINWPADFAVEPYRPAQEPAPPEPVKAA